MSNEVILNIVLAVITIISALITGLLIPYLKTKIEREKREEYMYYVDVAVKAAEQIYNRGGQGEKKKKYVVDWLAGQGIKLSDKDLDIMIEAAVKELNLWQAVTRDMSTVKTEKKKETTWSKQLCEENAINHPAEPGFVLVTKGDKNFTGMPYYFKGTLLEVGTSETFNNKTIWLIKNDNGYVMPVEMLDGENAEAGSIVEVWGTLTGDGYHFPNIDNVIGETGYLFMIQYNLNGEPKI